MSPDNAPSWPAICVSGGSGKSGGPPPLLGGEIRVSRRERQAVGFPHGLSDLDANREVEVPDEATHDRDLLEVLPAEEGGVRLHLEEELRDDGGNAAEVAGTDGSLPAFRDVCDLDRSRKTRRIELFRSRRVEKVHAFAFEQGGVPVEVPRVSGEVLARRELERVDEDRDDGEFARPSRESDEREMALVKRPHGRDEADACARRAGFSNETPQPGRLANGPHDRFVILSEAKDLLRSVNR